MKTRIITLLIAITAIIGSAYAQKKVNVYKNGEVVYSEYITEIDSIKFEEQTSPLPNTHNGHEYVDLGLPSGIKWATCNVGADTPEEYGDYFAWGETEPKEIYDWSTYKYYNGSSTPMTKYWTKSSSGTVDNKTVLELEDDAAYVNWGGKWRMPTRAEQEELMDTNNCTWVWITQNGVNGYIVISKINGNSIFLPAAGFRDYDNLSNAGILGAYWSSSLGTGSSNCTYYSYFNSNGVYLFSDYRDDGQSVRAVYSESTPEPTPVVCTVSVSATEGGEVVASATEVEEGTTVTLTATPKNGYSFLNWTVNGEVVSTYRIYTATITANTEFVANFVEADTYNGHEYVDLGLPSGIKWATCNVGATSPEEYGDYFAWGETAPKTTYKWSTYKYSNGSSTTMTKYCESSSYGTVDNKTTLELEDDAANANWGGNWRMPTEAEQDELRNTDNCTWEWITQNGVNGYKVTSKVNGNSIFLPAAGYRCDDDLSYADSNGYFWSSSLNAGNSSGAYVLSFDSSDVGWYGSGRYYGRSVRAVCE